MRFKSIYLSSCVSLALAGSAYAVENVTPLSDIPRLTVSGQSSFTAWIFHNHEKRINNLNFGNGRVVPGTDVEPETNDRTAVGIITYDKNPPLVFTTDDSRIKFSLDGPEGPWRYQAVVVFETDSNITNNIYQNYLGFQTPYGDLYVGDSFGVEDNMRFSGADAMAATGGFDGNAENVLFPTRGVNISIDLVGYTDRDTKISYFSPRWQGLQFGVSFTPQQRHMGSARPSAKTDYGDPTEPFNSNSVEVAINYIRAINEDVEIGLSGVGIFAESHPPVEGMGWIVRNSDGQKVASGSNERKNTRSFAFGADILYKNWLFAFEFGDNGRSQQLKESVGGVKLSSGYFWDVGLSYNFGATQLGVGYYRSERDAAKFVTHDTLGKTKAKANIYSVTLEHKLAPGLAVYGEWDYYQTRNPGANVDIMIANSSRPQSQNQGPLASNSSNVFALGTKIKF